MQFTIQIPDDLALRLNLVGADVSRRTLALWAAEGYRNDRLNKPDLRRLLGFETSYEIDGFLKAHAVYDDYTLDDFEDERTALQCSSVKGEG